MQTTQSAMPIQKFFLCRDCTQTVSFKELLLENCSGTPIQFFYKHVKEGFESVSITECTPHLQHDFEQLTVSAHLVLSKH